MFDSKKLIKIKVTELVVLVIIILGLNFSVNFVDNQILSNIVIFINQNILFIILLWLMGAINDASVTLSFPLKLISPPINGANSIIIIMFVLKIFRFIDTILQDFVISLYDLFNPFASKYYAHIFVVIMLFGYAHIFFGQIFKKKKQNKIKKETNKQIDDEQKNNNTHKDKKDIDNDPLDSTKISSKD